MKVLDLFAGLGGWSQVFKERGHEVITLDYEEKFGTDLVKDIREVTAQDIIDAFGGSAPDIILASPPCEKFSVMTIGRFWNLDNTPKNDKAQEAIDIVKAALSLIDSLNPSFWIMENPRGKLRKLDFMQGFERRTVTYCRLGENYMKPTDLWGNFPPSLVLPEPCKNGNPDHISASRGASLGVQDKRTQKFRGGMIEDMARYPSWTPERKNLSALRAMIPKQLSSLVCEAAEKDIP